VAIDALRGYLSLAGGLTDLTTQKAVAQAKALLSDESLSALVAGGQRAQVQVQAVADELLAAGRANRDVVTGLVRSEVERVVGAAGGASGDDVDALRASLDRLERRVAILESEQAARTAAARSGGTAKKTSAKKTSAKKTAAKKTSAKKTVKTATKSAPTSAKKAATKKSAATQGGRA
jgi:polyhydroxyalkanoate synthesis regulator phasin